ncbi:DNA modification methylase [Sulfitobacter sp. JL08]|uniref:DNA modification methylase n=1 Tax=Sulfitobacter sp. JL08 TaxID=2070369 RepID=UPI0013B3CED0|nr:DNA modification methylase [Sulfitobacter sp. JL08]
MKHSPDQTPKSVCANNEEPDRLETHSCGTSESVKAPESYNAEHGKNDLFRHFALVWVAVNIIDAAPRRVRRALKNQEEEVLRAIERFGFRIPILVKSKPGGERYEVIDGHTRLAAALRLDAEKVPCIVVDDLSEVETRRLALSLNKLQEKGSWDPDELRLEINDIIEISGDIQIPGFEMPEIEAIRFGGVEHGEADPADEIADHISNSTQPVTRLGDIWCLGDHLIYCASARDTVSIAALLDGHVVDAVFTDPPYNVKINGHVRDASGGFAEFAEASGEMSREAFIAFLIETLGNVVTLLKPGGVIFACMDWRHVDEMADALAALKLNLLNICVWVKSAAGMGSLYRSQHEFVFVARREGAGHQNNVQLGKYGRNRSNVWHYAGATGGAKDGDDAFDAHPTVKPIRMVMDALLDVTDPGDLVLDPFLGSGTTLLATERTRRRCIGVEIDPVYVDMAIRRWQEMTGGAAELVQKGEASSALVQGAGHASSETGAPDNREDF